MRWVLTFSATVLASCGATSELVAPPGDASISDAISVPTTHYATSAPTAAQVPFIDACAVAGHMEFLAGADDQSAQTSLAFPFRYWATDLPAGAVVTVVSNGWIGMDGVTNSALTGTIPSAVLPNAVIAPYWGDDMNRSVSPQCIATVGTAPHRSMVFEWHDAAHCCPADTMATVHLTYEVVLTEGAGTIDFIYQQMAGTRAQTVGIENQGGTAGLSGCSGGSPSCAPATGERIRFTPVP